MNTMINSLRTSFKTIRFRHVLPDCVIILLSLYVSLYLRLGDEHPSVFNEHLTRLNKFAPVLLAIRLSVLFLTGSYTILWRYVSASDAVRLTRAVTISSIVIIVLSFFTATEFGHLPRSVYLIDSILVLLGLMSIRLQRRVVWEGKDTKRIRQGQRTLIYGAGENGRMLAQRYSFDAAQGTHLVGFVDDDPKKQGLNIDGAPVLGTRETLFDIIEKFRISKVIIAATAMPGEAIREVVQGCRPYNIRPRIISRAGVGSEKDQNIDIDRDVNLSDLLNRSPHQVDMTSLKEMIRGKKVLVTGAGGSIGSEIARQVMAHEPSRLILLDHSEYNLYEIDKELRLSAADMGRVVPLLIDIKEASTLENRLKELSPEIIFHAAAYKHVHLVESNPYASILNNITGTKNLLEIAKDIDVSHFVLISSDKAVNPAGVMGATKRVCELMTTAAARVTGKNYVSVRFGNVLGSSGSLIPLLHKQISEGGPVTVTHKDMTRYFMTIPEAVSLVLKAATIARPGDINVLKMGEPVKILNVAKSMIALLGKTEDEVSIIFTGLRPGEKIYEELYLRGDELKTEHPDILTLPDGDTDLDIVLKKPEELFRRIEVMGQAAENAEKEALYEVNNLVKSTYVPPENIKDESQKVTNLIGPNQKVH